MKNHISFLFGIWFLTLSLLQASNHPSPGGFGIDGQFLYLRPDVNDTFFVIRSLDADPILTGTKENNDFRFYPGFRVGAAYAFCDCDCPSDISIDYTWLKASQRKTISSGVGESLFAVVGNPGILELFEGFPGSATSRLYNLHERVDALYNAQVLNNSCVKLYLNAGFEFAYVKYSQDYTFINTDPIFGIPVPINIIEKNRFWGVGPEVGFELDYEIFRSDDPCQGVLSFNVYSSGSLLATENKYEVVNIFIVDTVLDINDRLTWRVIPALHTRFGLSYNSELSWISPCCSGNSLVLEIGYEFNSYFRGLTREFFPSEAAVGLTFNNFYNYNTQGLYTSATVKF